MKQWRPTLPPSCPAAKDDDERDRRPAAKNIYFGRAQSESREEFNFLQYFDSRSNREVHQTSRRIMYHQRCDGLHPFGMLGGWWAGVLTIIHVMRPEQQSEMATFARHAPACRVDDVGLNRLTRLNHMREFDKNSKKSVRAAMRGSQDREPAAAHLLFRRNRRLQYR